LDKSKGFWSLGRDCRAFTECWRWQRPSILRSQIREVVFN
jgi:hypothetical protein